MADLHHFKVTSKEQGTTLLAFLKEKLKEKCSAKALKRAIDGKGCRVNGRIEVFATHTLGAGDEIELEIALPPSSTNSQDILYEDENLLIWNKQAGVLSEPAYFPYPPVHRVDKETSGALILAKSETARKAMIALFRKKEVQKGYLAIVDGSINREMGTVDNFLGKKSAYAGQTVWGEVSEGEGLRAVTRWRRLATSANASLLYCEPVTGRTHQLRVHLSGLGHPILGDAQYGRRFLSSERPKRHLLHAYSLKFRAPISGNAIFLTAPLPLDFKNVLARLFPAIPAAQLRCRD